METIKVATLIQALDLVGQVYRNKDGSGPADAIRKIQQRLGNSADITLAEWVETKQSKPKSSAKKGKETKVDEEKVGQALARLEEADTHTALSVAIAGLALTAGEWQALSKKLTGRPGRSGKAARELIERQLSDRLLLTDRVGSVKRLFG